jgi:hypothetical protein
MHSQIAGVFVELVRERGDTDGDKDDGSTTVSDAACAWEALLSSAISDIPSRTARVSIASKQAAASFSRS